MKKSLIPIFLSFVLFSGSVGIAEAAALTQQQINAIIGLLRSFGVDEGVVANVSATLGGTGASGGTQQWCHTFNTNLKIGDSNKEVTALHQVLFKEGLAGSDLDGGTGAGVGDSYGEETASAVTGFQEKYRSEILTPLGLKYGTGYVGKSTRAKLNQLYGCGGVTKPSVSAGYLEIEPSSASIAVGGSVSMQAMYQPPMPKCPEGFACPQVMPARYPVVAEWTSSNPGVASIETIGSCMAIGCPVPTSVLIKGISNGTADIKASYKSPSGTFLTATARITVGSGSTAPSITVLSPNGGEARTKGVSYPIEWNYSGISASDAYIRIELRYASNPSSWAQLINSTPLSSLASKTSLNWSAPPALAEGKYFIWIGIYNSSATTLLAEDYSDSPFSIVAASAASFRIYSFTGVYPTYDPRDRIDFETAALLTADPGSAETPAGPSEGFAVEVLVTNPEENFIYGNKIFTDEGGEYKNGHWYLTALAPTNPGSYKLKVTHFCARDEAACAKLFGQGAKKTVSQAFTVAGAVTPSITVTYPNGGEALIKGQSYFIRWAQTGFASDGWIQLQLRDAVNSSTMVKLITSSVPLGAYAGSFNWTVPTDIPDGKYLIWATAGSGLDSLGTRVLGSDFSNAPFTISATPAGAADASSNSDGSFAALLFSLERQLEELERILNSLLP